MGRLRFLTAGESHGKGLVAIIEGMVAGLPLSEDFISHHLKRRQAGYGRSSRMKIEQDAAEIISGVRFGFTVGSPISLVIRNRVWEEWQKIMSVAPQGKRIEPLTMPRPGHADLAGAIKYGLDDIRPILERASARETAARVAVGAVARRFLEQFGVTIHSHTVSIGELQVVFDDDIDWEQVEKSPLRCANAECEKAMVAAID
ncbi:MAG: chorismate synthase, partial [Chloroflexi bacterium]|nr:chorismate synthase [Chloroflexota bacterium]